MNSGDSTAGAKRPPYTPSGWLVQDEATEPKPPPISRIGLGQYSDSDSAARTIGARIAVLEAIQQYANHVLEGLRVTALPVFAQLPNDMKRSVVDPENFRSLAEASEVRTALELWGSKYGIGIGWVYEQAIVTLAYWDRESSAQLEWGTPPIDWIVGKTKWQTQDFAFWLSGDHFAAQLGKSAALALDETRDICLSRRVDSATGAYERSSRRYPKGPVADGLAWNPKFTERSEFESCARNAFNIKLKAYCDAQERLAQEAKLQAVGRALPQLAAHAKWLVLFQCCGQTNGGVSDTEATDKTNLGREISKLAELLGIELRPHAVGGRKRNSAKRRKG